MFRGAALCGLVMMLTQMPCVLYRVLLGFALALSSGSSASGHWVIRVSRRGVVPACK